MTNRTSRLLAFAGCSIVSATLLAQPPVTNSFGARQVPGPFGRPVVSPYVNLLRGNNPVLDYYGIVRPELEFQQANVRIETSINRLDAQLRAQNQQQTANSQLSPTGRTAAFLTDLRGQPETLAQDMQTRRAMLELEALRAGRTVAPSGHTVVYGNRGYFFRRGVTP